jgi:alkylation response protein AidB-like acyl-CoA dehydrogenase
VPLRGEDAAGRGRGKHALSMAALTPAQRDVVARAARVTRERIAPHAAEVDREARNPVESWRELWKEGFLAAAVPATHGGLDLDMPTYVGVIRTIAQGCASTAMTLHMHSTVMRFIDALGTDAQKRRWYAAVVDRGELFGSWGSEPAVSLSRTFLMETAVRVDGDELVVDGVKHFCTMALGASHYMIWCAIDGSADMGKALLQVIVPAGTPGIETDGKWDTLGMRGTYSPTVALANVRVPADAGLGRPGSATQVGVVESFALGYAAVYLGIAEAAFDFAVDYAGKRIVKPENVPVANDPTVQRHLGALRVHLDAARLVLGESAAGWADADVLERGLLANRAKYLATETGLQVTEKVIQVVGGRGAYRDFIAERAFRDLRTSTLMPPTVDRMIETIGKSALGISDAMFRMDPGARGA